MSHIQLYKIVTSEPNTQAANALPTPEIISNELLLLNNQFI